MHAFSATKWTYIGPVLFFSILGALLVPTQKAEAHHRPPLTVEISNEAGEVTRSFELATENEYSGATISVDDLGNDGVDEIVVGLGFGNAPLVHILEQDGDEILNFSAYDHSMLKGIEVVTCDPDGDGDNDIITSPMYGAGPHVRLFDSMGEVLDGDGLMAYNEAFRGGVHLSCGDVDADGHDELITSPGPTGGPHVRVWDFVGGSWELHTEFFAFDGTESNGLLTRVVDGNIVTQLQKPKLETPKLRTFSVSSNATLLDVTEATIPETTSQDTSDLGNDGSTETISVAGRPYFIDSVDPKKIIVDISDQRLYAYEYGVLAKSFLVSTGAGGWTTPIGNHSVLATPEFVHYAWFYGPDNPNNYDLGLVQWNIRIFPHIYIHYAPWHNNFGHPMSHGCINVDRVNIEDIYNWTLGEEGMPVDVVA